MKGREHSGKEKEKGNDDDKIMNMMIDWKGMNTVNKRVKIIAAASSNLIIGRAGQLPWCIPEVCPWISSCCIALRGFHYLVEKSTKNLSLHVQDRAWFERKVEGGVFILGRRSYEETGRAIPGVYASVVITRNPKASYADAEVACSFQGRCRKYLVRLWVAVHSIRVLTVFNAHRGAYQSTLFGQRWPYYLDWRRRACVCRRPPCRFRVVFNRGFLPLSNFLIN